MAAPWCLHGVLIAASLISAQPVIALVKNPASDIPRSQLVVQLSDALQAFDRGSTLLNSAPGEALAAFREARDGFQAVVDAGVENGQLYYNLGNTHLRLDDLGKAIAAYRRAQRLTPDDERLKANLRFARSLRRSHIQASGKRTFLRTVFFWHYSLPLPTRRTGAMVGYSLFWVFLAVRGLRLRVNLRYPVLASLALWLPLSASVAIDLRSRSTITEGVLVADDVVVRKGNGEGYDAQFEQPLSEGVELRVIEHRGGWVRIELADGNQGWVREREVCLLD